MTVEELIAELEACDSNAVVLLSGDEDSSWFEPVHLVQRNSRFCKEDGFIYPEEDFGDTGTPEDAKCVVLWA